MQKEPSPPKYQAAGEGCSSKNKTLWSNTESPASKKRRKGTRNGDDVNVIVIVKHMQSDVFIQGYSQWQWEPPWSLVWEPGSHLCCIYSPCEEGLWWVAHWSEKQTSSKVVSELGVTHSKEKSVFTMLLLYLSSCKGVLPHQIFSSS